MDDFGSGSLATLLIDLAHYQQEQEYDETIWFASYEDYLQSDIWKEKSDAAKARAGWKCQLNVKHSNKVLHTHHRTYERIGNELDTDLIVLCNGCHKKFHSKESNVQCREIAF